MHTQRVYDVLIIGGGIIGSAICYELSSYAIKIALLEKNPVFADETSKGNSGVIHGGFDPRPNTWEAKLNILGNQLWQKEVFPYLAFPKTKVNSLVIAFDQQEVTHLEKLYHQGLENGVLQEHLQIIDQQQLFALEPHINKQAVAALLCTNSYAINPIAASHAFLAAAQNNKANLFKNQQVNKITTFPDHFVVHTNQNYQFLTKRIINVAGIYADYVANLIGCTDFTLKIRKGEYRILERDQNRFVKNICFMVPTIHGKGVIVAPMLDGHVLVGPTAQEGVAKADNRLVSLAKYHQIGIIGNKLFPDLVMERTIMTLAGSRPIAVATNDFVVAYASNNDRFINVAGTQSPGLSAAPAFAKEVVQLLRNKGVKLFKKVDFNPYYEVFY